MYSGFFEILRKVIVFMTYEELKTLRTRKENDEHRFGNCSFDRSNRQTQKCRLIGIGRVRLTSGAY